MMLACLMGAFLASAGTAHAASLSLPVGQKTDAAVVLGVDEGVTYKCSSSQKKVASVSKAGMVKAKLAGKATITLKEGKLEKTLKVTVRAKASSGFKKPAGVKRLSAVPSGSNGVTLSWAKVSRAAGYVIYRKVGSSYLPVRIVKGASSLSCTVKGLQPNGLQRFCVGAYASKKQECKKLVKAAKAKSSKGKSPKVEWVVKERKAACWALGKKSPYACTLVNASTTAKANVGSVVFGRKQLTIVGKGSGEAMASVVSSVSGAKVASGKIRYEVSDDSLASVSSAGVVTSKVKRNVTCKVTAYAHNGVRAKLKVRIVTALSYADAQFVGHRGNKAIAPDNSIASFAKASETGYKAVEFDVWETYDGSLVVNHDENLSSNCGIDLDVRELSTDPASEHYVGNYRITSGRDVSSFGTVTISSFEEMVRMAAAFDFSLMVHVKNRVADPLSSEGLAEMKRILKLYGVAEKTQVGSHSVEMLEDIDASGLEGKQFVVLLTSGFDIIGDAYQEGLRAAADAAKAAGCTSISLCWRPEAPIDEEYVAYCHKLGLEVDVWTITSKVTACYLVDIGVDGIICDKKLFG